MRVYLCVRACVYVCMPVYVYVNMRALVCVHLEGRESRPELEDGHVAVVRRGGQEARVRRVEGDRGDARRDRHHQDRLQHRLQQVVDVHLAVRVGQSEDQRTATGVITVSYCRSIRQLMWRVWLR